MRFVPLAFACGILFPVVLNSPALAERFAAQRPFPLVKVSGEGTATLQPDTAHLAAGVSTEAKTPREAAEANAKLMSAVMAAAGAAGIADRDIRTARFSIYPIQASRKRDEPPQVVGYRVSNQVQVKLRDLAKIGEVIDRLISAGATDMGGIAFSASDLSKKRDEARAAAFADAKRKAEHYAQAAGAQIGRALSIDERGGGAPHPVMRTEQLAAAAAPPISPGEETVRVQVDVSFELVQ